MQRHTYIPFTSLLKDCYLLELGQKCHATASSCAIVVFRYMLFTKRHACSWKTSSASVQWAMGLRCCPLIPAALGRRQKSGQLKSKMWRLSSRFSHHQQMWGQSSHRVCGWIYPLKFKAAQRQYAASQTTSPDVCPVRADVLQQRESLSDNQAA